MYQREREGEREGERGRERERRGREREGERGREREREGEGGRGEGEERERGREREREVERGREIYIYRDSDREIWRELGGEAPNDTAYKWWSCDSGYKLLCTLCRNHPPDLPFFWASRQCGRAGWLVMLLIKAGDVETNPGPTTSHKRVWICDICHDRKQQSIRYNRIEHWVHLRCAGIRQSQYTDTWTRIYSGNPDSHLTHT